MNKKNLFLGLALLLCANQISAGWMDSVKSSFREAATWVVSWMPESWQGRTCVALGVCTLAAAGFLMSRGNSISMAEAKRVIGSRTAKVGPDERASVEAGCTVVNHSDFKAAYNSWSNDQLIEAYNILINHANEAKNKTGLAAKAQAEKYISWANEVLEVWVEKALNKKVFDSKKNRKK
jgi:hypothetical protein